jgi:antitoxin component YwqK of YwqJK toxin-antitoxin module
MDGMNQPLQPPRSARGARRLAPPALLLAATLAACTGEGPAPAPQGGQATAPAGEAPAQRDRPPEIDARPLAAGQTLDVLEVHDTEGRLRLRREVLRDEDGIVNHGRFQRWHPNGVLAEDGWYLEGHKHGTYVVVAETGIKESEVTYDRGQREGLALAWGQLGQLKERAHYVADRLDGEYEAFAGQNPKAKGRYEDGLEEGPWTYWYPEGTRREEGRFQAGQREGPWRFWRQDGTLESEQSFHGGALHGPAVEYDEAGRKLAERSYRDGVPDGLQVEYHPDGSVQSEARFSAGRLEGLQRRWYPDGTLQMEGPMRAGKREGRWTYYHTDGTVNEAWSGQYEADERVSG